MLLSTAPSGQRRLDFAQPAQRTSAGWRVSEEAIMGTAIRVELWCDDARHGAAAAAAVMDEMHRIDRAMSPHKPASELKAEELECKLLAGVRQFDFGARDVEVMIVTWPVDFLLL